MLTTLHRRSNAFRRHAAYDLAIRQITGEIEDTNRRMQEQVLRFAEAYASIVSEGLSSPQLQAADSALAEWQRLLAESESLHDRIVPLLRQRADRGVVAIDKGNLEAGIATCRTKLLEVREQLRLNIARMNTRRGGGS